MVCCGYGYHEWGGGGRWGLKLVGGELVVVMVEVAGVAEVEVSADKYSLIVDDRYRSYLISISSVCQCQCSRRK